MNSRYELIYERAPKITERYEVPPDGLFIGRGPENHISLQDQAVSRRHARVWIEEGVLKVQDLGSRNGIEINGLGLKEGVLRANDKLVVGNAVFEISRAPDSTIGHTVIGPEKAAALYRAMLQESHDRRLLVLYRAAQLLGTVFDLDDLLHQILELIFDALPVRRGFALTVPEPGAEPEVRASRSREKGNQGPPLSRTLIQHVFIQNNAILTLDAQQDSRFDAADSIVDNNIHSAMCAPLQGREAVVGAIYVDSGSSQDRFSRADLELLTAIARVVGVAVENARLYQDAVNRERMAAIGEATAGLGHCIKNILTGIRGGGELMSTALQKKDLKYLERGWAILSRAIDRIDMLVMNLLTFSRDREPERIVTDINALLNEVIDVVRPRAVKYEVELVLKEDPGARVSVDSRQIFRAFLNVVMNAVEAVESTKGRVIVSTIAADEGVFVRVQDNGPGIAPEILPRLSQAFVSTKGSSGTGLGLACTYKIVREHGGSITVDGGKGRGATFAIFLPHVQYVNPGTHMATAPAPH